ncbi:unnamed protein product [Cochlearia groenlandica]
MANSFFFIYSLVIILTIFNGICAAENGERSPSETIVKDNSTKSLIESLGPSQDYPDYEIPKELAPDGVMVAEDYVPISPTGGQEYSKQLAQPEADTLPSGSASRSSLSTIVFAVGGAILYFF